MDERNNDNLLYAIAVLGDTLQTKEFMLRVKDDMITRLEGELAELKNKIASEHGSEEQYESTIKGQEEYIKHLEAKIYDLEERIAIMTETEAQESACEFPMSEDAPVQPSWEITPPKEVIEVTNVTKVLEGE